MKTKKEIIGRALSLGALLYRANYEALIWEKASQKKVWKNIIFNQLNPWLKKNKIKQYSSEDEFELLSRQCGTWSRPELFEIMWRKESLVILLWTLNMFQSFPDYSTNHVLDEIIEKIPVDENLNSFMNTSIRSKDELEEHFSFSKQKFQDSAEAVKKRIQEVSLTGICASIIYERHYALSWILTDKENYDWNFKDITECEEYRTNECS